MAVHKLLSKIYRFFHEEGDNLIVPTTPKFWGKLCGVGLLIFGIFNLIAPPSNFPGVNMHVFHQMTIAAVGIGALYSIMSWRAFTKNSQFIVLSITYISGLALFGIGYGKIYGPVELQLLAPIASVWVGITQPKFRSLILAPFIIIVETLPSLYYKVPIARFFVGSILTTAAFVLMAELIRILIEQLRTSEHKAVELADRALSLAEIAQIAENDQRNQAREMTVVFDTSGDIISLLDFDGNLKKVSKAATEMLGKSTNFKIGGNIFLDNLINEQDEENFRTTCKMIKLGQLNEARIRFQLKSKFTLNQDHYDFIKAEATLKPLHSHDDSVESLVMVVRDISDQVRIEGELKDAVIKADSANVAKTEFLARMSHELRTPLNSILGFGHLLAVEDLDEIQKDSINRIVGAGQHLLSLINDILDLAKVEAGHTSLQLEPIEINSIVSEVMSLMSPIAANAKISIEASNKYLNSEYSVIADRKRFTQVLLNLFSNAIKYNSQNGTISIDIEEESGLVSIKVSDSGNGIREEDYSKVFLPFERLGREQSSIEGTGIGLALCKQLVELMGGNLDFTSEVGCGTTFFMTFQTTLNAEHSSAQVTELDQKLSATDRELVRYLYVEDNEANRHLMKRIFEKYESFLLDVADNVAEAIELLDKSSYNVILLDLQLPEVSGLDFLKILKSRSDTSNIPVVVVSASAMQSDIDLLHKEGAYSYITKPIDIDALEEIIEQTSRIALSQK